MDLNKLNDKQNVEIFKFFEKTKQRKTSNKSPKSKQQKSNVFKLPPRRSTRLKSQVLVENLPEILPEGEYDISMEEFDSSNLAFEPIRKKIKLSETTAEITNDESVANGVSTTLDSDDTHLKQSNSKLKTRNNKTEPQVEQMVDNFIESIDTSVIAELLKNTNLDTDSSNKDEINTKTSKNKRKPNNTENCEQQLDVTNKSSESCARVPEPTKKRGRKPKNFNNSSTTKSNGKLNYFSVQDKKLDENANNNVNSLNDKSTELTTPNEISVPISKQKKTSIRKAEISKTKQLNQSGNPEKKIRGRPVSAKQLILKVNVAKEFHKKTSVKFSKLSKKDIEKGLLRKIPKNRLDGVLEMINDEDHPMWEDRNISCNPRIHTHWSPVGTRQSDQNIKIKFAREFLLRRDWINLSKILCLNSSELKSYYPLLSKYATLLLAHTDKEQFAKCVQFLTTMDDSSAVIKKCTQI